MSEPSQDAAPPERDPVTNALRALAGGIRKLHEIEATGELAALRRMDPEHPEDMALLRLSVLPAVGKLVSEMEAELGAAEPLRRIAAIAQIMAMRPDSLRPWGLGGDLAAAAVTGRRLGVLLTARGATLRDTARRLARRLAREGNGFAYEHLGKLLILSDWREAGAEEARISLARDVARAERKTERESAEAAA